MASLLGQFISSIQVQLKQTKSQSRKVAQAFFELVQVQYIRKSI